MDITKDVSDVFDKVSSDINCDIKIYGGYSKEHIHVVFAPNDGRRYLAKKTTIDILKNVDFAKILLESMARVLNEDYCINY